MKRSVLHYEHRTLEAHPAAELFPMMPDEGIKSLAVDIEKNGLQVAITLLDGMILDGRNRLRACEIAGVEPRFESTDTTDPIATVLSLNLERRHLSATQKAFIGERAEIMRDEQEKARERQLEGLKKGTSPVVEKIPQRDAGKSRDKVAALVGVNPRYISDAASIRRAAPEVAEVAEAGKVNMPQAKKLAALPEAERSEACWRIRDGEDPKELIARGSSPGDVERVKPVRDGPTRTSEEAEEFEREVVERVSRGQSVVDICKELGVPSHRVQHVKKLYGLTKGARKDKGGPLDGVIQQVESMVDALESALDLSVRLFAKATPEELGRLVEALGEVGAANRKLIGKTKREIGKRQ